MSFFITNEFFVIEVLFFGAKKSTKRNRPGSLATPPAWLPSRGRFFRRGQELAGKSPMKPIFESSTVSILLAFHRHATLKQPARFLRKNQPPSAALQRAGIHHNEWRSLYCAALLSHQKIITINLL